MIDVVDQYAKLLDECPYVGSIQSRKTKFSYNYLLDKEMWYEVTHLPISLYSQLKRYQKDGIKFVLDHFGRCLIGDEMGVGKTLQGISVAKIYWLDWPFLVICPTSLKLNWKLELKKWLINLDDSRIMIIHTGSSNKEKFPDDIKSKDVYIMSYEIAKAREKELKKHDFKMIICDEAHLLKSRDSKRSVALRPILQNTKRWILMSGTPMLAAPFEIFNLVQILRPDVFTDFGIFANLYCDPKRKVFHNKTIIDYKGSANLSELNYWLTKHIMIRRLKKDVLSELPDKTRIQIPIEVGKAYK